MPPLFTNLMESSPLPPVSVAERFRVTVRVVVERAPLLMRIEPVGRVVSAVIAMLTDMCALLRFPSEVPLIVMMARKTPAAKPAVETPRIADSPLPPAL